jgi:hypothetical protein
MVRGADSSLKGLIADRLERAADGLVSASRGGSGCCNLGEVSGCRIVGGTSGGVLSATANRELPLTVPSGGGNLRLVGRAVAGGSIVTFPVAGAAIDKVSGGVEPSAPRENCCESQLADRGGLTSGGGGEFATVGAEPIADELPRCGKRDEPDGAIDCGA